MKNLFLHSDKGLPFHKGFCILASESLYYYNKLRFNMIFIEINYFF